jgi:hypothetical protein
VGISNPVADYTDIIDRIQVSLTAFKYISAQSKRPSPSGAETRQQEQTKPTQANQAVPTEQKAATPQPIIVNVEPSKKTEAEAEADRRERKEKADREAGMK